MRLWLRRRLNLLKNWWRGPPMMYGQPIGKYKCSVCWIEVGITGVLFTTKDGKDSCYRCSDKDWCEKIRIEDL